MVAAGRKYVCIPAFQSRATYVGSTISLQVPAHGTCRSAHPRIRFSCNSSASSKNLQHGCAWYKIHEFLRGRLQLICKFEKSATHLQVRSTELAGNLQGTCRQVPTSSHTIYGNLSEWDKNKLQSQTKKRKKRERPPSPPAPALTDAVAGEVRRVRGRQPTPRQ